MVCLTFLNCCLFNYHVAKVGILFLLSKQMSLYFDKKELKDIKRKKSTVLSDRALCS